MRLSWFIVKILCWPARFYWRWQWLREHEPDCRMMLPYLCPHCYHSFDKMSDIFYREIQGGTCYSEYDNGWFSDGIQTCPRCFGTWEYGDSGP